MTGLNPKIKRTMLCPNCGTIQRIGGKCGICGYPIVDPEVKVLEKCPNCGKLKPVDSRCPWCGHKE